MRRHGVVEQTQKLEPFLVTMPLLAEAIDFAVGRIERRKQGCGAVAFVVMGQGLAATALERQAGLGTIQGLALGGFWRVVMLTTRRMKLAPILGVRPGRGASFSNPARPMVRNR